ncbi:hypothetical protein CPLU01_05814 [Colletotrichum plurivorum]|uniref:Uncharacterized protein n=1 Tax=Colletotrichum plurivorum TaxID=2175906 RepID=A0A8H6KL88_9PEZI|nr:hypothetical protein CPLU01_05814 [Colletotrichum plurivorum]
MKSTSTLSLFFVTALLFQGLAAAWQFPSLQFPLVPTWLGGSPPTPNVPKFILDAQHPWLQSHAAELAALDDPTSLLCAPLVVDTSFDPESIECGHGFDSRGLSGEDVPGDFFHRLEIDNNRAGIDRLGWDNARHRLLEMRDCPRALDEVRELKVDIWLHDPEKKAQPADVPQLFAQVLTSMKNLEKLDWTLRGYEENLVFGKNFVDEDGMSLSVAEVKANMYATTWLLDAAPGVKVLEVGRGDWGFDRADNHFDYYKVWLRAASKLKGLRGLNMGAIEWEADMTELIPELFPEIEELWIGSIEKAAERSSRSREGGGALKGVIRALAKLPNLRMLHLPDPSELDFGFHGGPPGWIAYDGGPWCGNAYGGEDGERLRRQVETDRIGSAEQAGEIVRAEFPSLKGVEVGAHSSVEPVVGLACLIGISKTPSSSRLSTAPTDCSTR